MRIVNTKKLQLISRTLSTDIFAKLRTPLLALLGLIVFSTFFYWVITNYKYSLLDCFYMVMITILTIGYGEIINLQQLPIGRLYTIFLALTGIGLATYMVTYLAALFIEGHLQARFKLINTMDKAQELTNHYIICGSGRIGYSIATELAQTSRPFVLIEKDEANFKVLQDENPTWLIINGDATDDDTLTAAGIANAAGLFCATNDDNANLVVALSAKQLNPAIRVVSMCKQTAFIPKIEKAGADKVISPYQIGGLRMAAEMVRPSVTSFLDDMLRDNRSNYRFEEFTIPTHLLGKTLQEAGLLQYEDCNLLAIRKPDSTAIYQPKGSYTFAAGDVLVAIVNPTDRSKIEAAMEG